MTEIRRTSTPHVGDWFDSFGVLGLSAPTPRKVSPRRWAALRAHARRELARQERRQRD